MIVMLLTLGVMKEEWWPRPDVLTNFSKGHLARSRKRIGVDA
jgi:hypothetical protein